MKKKIFASAERQKELDLHGIKWKFDQDLNFIFASEAEEKKAIKVLRQALLL
jgi:hypothetical protein